MKKRLLITVTSLMLLFMYNAAYADSTKDIETIARSIGFVNGGPKGSVQMDILYDPNNPASIEHANEIERLSDGIGGKVKLTGKKVNSIESAQSQVIFMTRGTEELYSAALNQAAQNKGLTVSTDEECLGSGCVLVVKTQPSVDILVSTKAAEQTRTEFSSVFSMMVTKK